MSAYVLLFNRCNLYFKILLQMCFCALGLNGTIKNMPDVFDFFFVFLCNVFSSNISARIIRNIHLLFAV